MKKKLFDFKNLSKKTNSRSKINFKGRFRVFLLLAVFLLSLLPVYPALADNNAIDYNDTYKYLGTGINGTNISGTSVGTRKFDMTGGYAAFCVDINTTINTNSNYVKLPLDHTESLKMFHSQNARPDKIRALLTYGWDKTSPNEITAIQYALWNEMHGTQLPSNASSTIKNIYNKLVDDAQTPPIPVGEGLNPNTFTLTGPTPDQQQYVSGTTNYSFDFSATSNANIIFAVFDSNEDQLAEANYDIQDKGNGNYTLTLKNVASPSGYRLQATTLKNTAVDAHVFLSFSNNTINTKLSQTVAGVKLSETTQSASFNVNIYPYTAEGSITLSGNKTLTGRTLTADEFEFSLYEGDDLIDTAKNLANGSFSFAKINYTQEDIGSKTYTVKEKPGTLGGVAYDTSEHTVIVNISDNGDGTLKVEIDEESDALEFRNTYSATGSMDLSGSKTLSGRALKAGEFEFALYEDGKIIDTAQNLANGSFSFGTINYTLGDVGEKIYTVIERAGTAGGVTYDTTQYTVKVNISDNRDGTLDVVIDEESDNPDALDFTNTYEAEGKIDLSGNKILTGRAMIAGEFEFALYEGEALVETTTNAANGSFSFGTIDYTLEDVGYKTYMIVETTGTAGGVTYDDKTVTVIVNITDNGDGTLSATIDQESDAISFTNTYEAEGSIDLSGNKTLTGRAMAAEEFEFALYEGEALVETTTNAANGSFSFGTIDYTLEDVGYKTYMIVETAGTAGGVTYDDKTVTVIVNITDNGDGTLSATIDQESDAISFTNTYEAEGSIDLSGNKTLTGRAMAAEEFEFALYEGEALVETTTNAANGSFSFGTIDYTLEDVGSKTYTVVETAGTAGGVTYDATEYTVIVNISDNGDGTLTVEIDEESDDLNFTNTYTAAGSIDLSGNKTLTGRDLVAGEFEFELYEGDNLIETATNAADGSYSFGTINYTLEDVGSKIYTVVENNNGLTGVTYDTTEYLIEVIITDGGEGELDITTNIGIVDPDSEENDFELMMIEFNVAADELDFTNTYFEETEETTTETTPEETTLPTLPVITVETEPLPLAPVDPTLPVIQPITETLPLAPALPTIEVIQEQIPQSGENAPVWPIGLALVIIAAGMGYLVNKSKKSNVKENDDMK